MSVFWWTTGELPLPQLMSHSPNSLPRCRVQTARPAMSTATTWPVPNTAYTRCPSVTGLALARLCLSCTGGNDPSALVSWVQTRRPSAALNASMTNLHPASAGGSRQRAFRVRAVGALAQTRTDRAGARPDLSGHEDLTAPHHRRRHTRAAQPRPPRDVRLIAPRLGQLRFAGYARAARAAPAGPVFGRRDVGHACDGTHHRQRAKNDDHGRIVSERVGELES